MKLSSFSPDWFGEWPVSRRPLEEYSRAGLTNFLGSVQSGNDVSSIRHPVFPPVSGCEESTAYLTVNGAFLPALGLETEHRWTPWAFLRRCSVEGVDIESRTSMPPDMPAVVMSISFTNSGDTPAPLDIALRLSGRCVNRGIERWFWGIPQVGLTVTDLHDQGGMNPFVEPLADRGLLFGERQPGKSTRAWCGQAADPAPDDRLDNGDLHWRRELRPGETFTLHLALCMSEDREEAASATEIATRVPELLAMTEDLWRRLWREAFTGGDSFSGVLTDLDLPEDLAPLAAASVFSALLLRRTHRPNRGKVRYSISMPRRVEACFYPNDWAMAARLLVELDPEPTWEQLEMALRADIRVNNQVNTLTGKGGDFQGRGWPYTIDIYNLFTVGWWFVRHHGTNQLDRVLDTTDGPRTLLQVLEDLAFDHRSRLMPGTTLADYGPRQELLECVSTYEHGVAGLNAAAVWMLDRLADLYEFLGRADDAAGLREEAGSVAAGILDRLYVEGAGWFRALQPDGSTRVVRHCWDVSLVLMCLADRLPDKVAKEIAQASRKELMTDTWMRALSPFDGDAAVSGTRADHQYNGAFGSWPAFLGLGLARTGRGDEVREWFRGVAKVARQGPIAQAYTDERVAPPVQGAAAKVTDELPQCCHWCNLSGGMFYEVLADLFPSTPPRSA